MVLVKPAPPRTTSRLDLELYCEFWHGIFVDVLGRAYCDSSPLGSSQIEIFYGVNMRSSVFFVQVPVQPVRTAPVSDLSLQLGVDDPPQGHGRASRCARRAVSKAPGRKTKEILSRTSL